MNKNSSKRVYRICPCNSWNIEAIQSWLEDMAAKGLFLEKDGLHWKVFSFERKSPQKVKYRLDVAKKHKSDDESEVTFDEKELYRSMGWEYLVHYGDFNIYRSTEMDAPELNTEPETHALTINLLKKKYRSSLLGEISWVLILLLTGSLYKYPSIMLVHIGFVLSLCFYGFLLWWMVVPLVKAIRFRSYEKRLLNGDSLNQSVDWKKITRVTVVGRLLTIVIWCGFASTLLLIPEETYLGPAISVEDDFFDTSFATVADMFPNDVVLSYDAKPDYGTYRIGDNVISKNVEWNERCDVKTTDGENYFCILRIDYHETASELIAKGLENDYYVSDSTRRLSMGFKEFDAPKLDVDSIHVYNSDGSLYVLMREGNRVVRALVDVNNNNYENQWQLWAQAMADKLKAQD